MTVFDRIKELSDKRGISLQKAAVEMGFSENLFYQWKNSQPKADRLERVADYFGVSTDYLLGRTDTPDTTQQGKKPRLTVEEAMASVMSRDGKPLSEHDQEILVGIIEAYIEKSKDE